MIKPLLFSLLPALGCALIALPLVAEETRADTVEEVLSDMAEETRVDATGGSDPVPVVGEDAAAAWEEVQDMALVEGAMRLAEAENLYLEARARYQRAYFVEAKDLIDRALEVFPAHAGAQELREDILGILSLRSDRLRMMARWMGALGEVAVQETAVRLAGLLEEGDKAMAARDYMAAARFYDRVAIGIRTFPYRFNWGDLPDVVQAKIFEAQSQARQDDLLRQREARRSAADVADHERRREEALLRAKVDAILSRAHRHYVRGDFRRAAIEAWNAYELDRRREDARSLYLDARRKAHVQFDDYLKQEQPERVARVYENIHQALIPQADLMIYPQNWFEINMRRPEEIGERTEEGWQRELRDRLEMEVEFIWEDTMLEDAIEFLRQTTGVNFVVSPDVYAGGGPPPITLSGRMRLRTVLGWISQITRLEYTLRSQAVFISSDVAESDTVLRIYNVNDLLSPVQDFEGPELAWTGGGQAGGGFDLFGGGGGFGADPGGMDIMEIQDLIEQSVSPQSWDRPGVAIDIRQGGTLFINQTPDVHDLVAELLRSLRSQASLQVNTRIRILDLSKAFIEEIGFDYRGLDLLVNDNPGFSRFGNTWSSSSYLNNTRMPDNSMVTVFDGNAGLRLNGAFNRVQMNAILEAAQQEQDAIILNAPELTSFSGQRANAQFLRQVAFISDYAVDGTVLNPEIEVINTGDIIDVRPLVSADRKYVTLEVRPTSVLLQNIASVDIVNFVQPAESLGAIPLVYPIDMPNIEVRSMRSTVMLPDRGSLLVGGYVRGLRQRTQSGVPFLSHIPFLGRLFSRTGLYEEHRHLMYLLTVTIIDLDEMESLQ
ncbi:MAG: hypothetical protein EA402_06300 [Planctomycetota bacterium]|nr:MAG: hypothetical protein EA402_06300 [Planctomycetota bacterium]